MGAKKKYRLKREKEALKTMYFCKVAKCSYISTQNASRG